MFCPICLSDCWSTEADTLQPDNDLLVKYIELDAASCALAAREFLYRFICTDTDRSDYLLHPAESSISRRDTIVVRHQLVID